MREEKKKKIVLFMAIIRLYAELFGIFNLLAEKAGGMDAR